MMTVALALSLVSCTGNDYKAKGEKMSKELDEMVEKKDTAAVLSADETIRQVESDLIASKDSVGLESFRAAMKDARIRNAAFVSLAKIRNGEEKDKVVNELIQDALNDNVDIHAITSSIDVILKYEQQNEKK